MPKGLLFFCCACCILILTAINLSIGPVITKTVGGDYFSVQMTGFTSKYFYWGTANCKYFSDRYDDYKKDYPEITKEEKKYNWEWNIKMCKTKKGMHDMEYTAFIFDIVIGFVCGLIGLLHLFEIKNKDSNYVEKTGLIGIGCGGVGFILTFVYVIFNGLVYTKYYTGVDSGGNNIYKRNGDGAFAKLEGEDYKSLYFDKKGNYHAFIAKYNDLIKKQYNYDKDLLDSYDKDEVDKCINNPANCRLEDGICRLGKQYFDSGKACEYLYIPQNDLSEDVINKDVSDRFLTTLILSLFVCLANIGLALFGFLIAKSGEFD